MKLGDATKARILDAGVLLARGGLHRVTLRAIAASLKISHGNASYHFGGAEPLRAAVISRAIAVDDFKVIARLIMDDHPSVKNLSRSTRQKYLAGIMSGR